MEFQSLTTNPSKPISSLSTSFSKKELPEAGTPLMSLNEVITVATPASKAALKGGRTTFLNCDSCSSTVL